MDQSDYLISKQQFKKLFIIKWNSELKLCDGDFIFAPGTLSRNSTYFRTFFFLKVQTKSQCIIGLNQLKKTVFMNYLLI